MVEAAIIRRMIGDGVIVEQDAPQAAFVRLRGTGAMTLENLSVSLGVSISETPNCVRRAGAFEVCWLAPGVWLLVGGSVLEVHEKVAAVCEGEAIHHVADAGEAWRRWRITGQNAGALIAKGCAVDLHPRMFPQSVCARTLLGQVNVLLVRERDAWTVFAERALEEFLWAWFARAGREWRAEVAN